MGGNCFSPSSPMMKVREVGSKAVYSKFESVDNEQCAGQTWSEESPVKVAVKFTSPPDSSPQCKPAAAEMHNDSACTNLASCCDDHRLSAELQVCASSRGNRNNGIPASQSPPQSEQPFSQNSPRKLSAGDSGSADCVDMNAVTAGIAWPRQPVLSASIGDCLDNSDEINCGLEDLIVEPLWSRNEPDGLTAEGAEVVGISDDVRQKSRKSKNLNVRFDPSTKDPCSPVSQGMYCGHWHRSSPRSLDDSDIPYVSCGSRCHAAGLDGSASVRIRRRRYGHRGRNDIWSDVDVQCSQSHRERMNRGSGSWIDTGDDYEHCSTCSSSSTDSDFDYTEAAFSNRAVSMTSQTLPQRRCNAGLAGVVPPNPVRRSRKHKKKQCVIS